MRIDYRLTETFVTIRGTLVTETDRFDQASPTPQPESVTVEIGRRGDEGNGLRTLELAARGADAEFSIGLTADKRVRSLTYKTTGVGSRALKAGASLLAFVGGIAARAGFGAAGAAADALDAAVAVREVAPKHELRTPEQLAAAEWASTNPVPARLRAAYKESLPGLAQGILDARTEAAQTIDPGAQVAAMARARRLERLLDDARQEIAAVDALYRAWRATTISRREVELVRTLAVEELPEADQGTEPVPGHFEGHVAAVWESLGVTVQLEPGDGYAGVRRDFAPAHQPPLGDDAREVKVLRWRLPRPARITVWRRDPVSGLPVLERSTPVLVLDDRCATEGVELTSALFGSRSAELTFDDDGLPSALARSAENAPAAMLDALGAVPDQVVAGLEQASKVQAALGTLLDAGAQRRAAAAKRDLETAQSELTAKGLAATAEDYVRLQRLKQRVEIATAEGTLAPPSEVAMLEAELRAVTARRNLSTARRDEALDLELAEVRAETARLRALVERASVQGLEAGNNDPKT